MASDKLMSERSITKSTIVGAGWTMLEAFVNALANIVLLIVLTRLLEPEAFGAYAILLAITTVVAPFINVGLPAVVIQRRVLSIEAESTFSFLVLGLSLLMALAIAVLSEPFAAAFNEPSLKAMAKVTGLGLLIASIRMIYTVKLQRDLRLALIAKIRIIATILSGVFAVYAAVEGAGAWALVLQGIVFNSIAAIWTIAASRWTPAVTFDLMELRSLVRDGAPLMGISLLSLLDARLFPVFIGKAIGLSATGLFHRAGSLVNAPQSILNYTVNRVVLPVFSRIQDEPDRILRGVRLGFRQIGRLVWPLFFGIAVVSETAVIVIFGENWLPAAALLPPMAVAASMDVFSVILGRIILSKGERVTLFIVSALRTLAYVLAITVAFPFGLIGFAWAAAAAAGITLLIYLAVAFKSVGYSPAMFLSDLGPPIVYSFSMIAAVIGAGHVFHSASPIFELTFQVSTGVLVYALLLFVFERDFVLAQYGFMKRSLAKS